MQRLSQGIACRIQKRDRPMSAIRFLATPAGFG
jgi:hypothetical protein